VSNTVADSATLEEAASLDDAPATPSHPQVTASPGRVGELESVMLSIWQEVLGVDAIGLEDDFFVLGGHSLMAIQLIAEIRRRTGAEVPVKVFFESPTVAALVARIVDARTSNAVEESNLLFEPISRNGDLPLTFHQTDVWEFERSQPGTARFTGVIALFLRGRLVRAGLEFALNQILTRHEVLRTTYRSGEDGQPVARVNPPQSLSLLARDISHLENEVRERELLESANRLVRTSFNLGSDVLLRTVLFKIGEDEHVLVFSSHYIAVDSWTIGLILKELGEHYAAYIEARPSQLPAAKLQCVDYAHRQRSRNFEESITPHLAYWQQRLLDIALQEPLPQDRPRPRNKTMNGSTFHFALTPNQTHDLKRFSHEHGSTLFFTLLSALNVLFHIRSGMEDIVIGTITGDRDPGMETVFGSFVNCLPLRNHLHSGQTFLEVMENSRRCTTDAYSHQVPFHKISEMIARDRDLVEAPLFRSSLVLRNIPFTEMNSGGLQIQLLPLRLNRAVAEADLSLYLQEVGGVLSGYFEYDDHVFLSSTMERLSGDFITLLARCIDCPAARLCDLELAVDMVEKLSCAVC